MLFKIGWLELTPQSDDDMDPGPKNAEWHRATIVDVGEVPGKDKKFVTIRTTDINTPRTGTLEECTLTVKSITNERYQNLLRLCNHGGPYLVRCYHGTYYMYIIDRTVTHGESDKEPPLKELSESDTGLIEEESNHATWVIKMIEAND